MNTSHSPTAVVVGAGSFGLWTALHLQTLGCQVTLVDAWGPGNTRSSSGGESRVIRGMYGGDRIYTEWVNAAFDAWKAIERDSGTRIYRKTGSLWMFGEDDSYARESVPALNDAGLPFEKLTVADAARRFPQIQFDGIDSVYFEHEAGRLAARSACGVLCEQFVNRGGTTLIAQARPGRRVAGRLEEVLLSDGSALRAEQYVFACGPWLGQILPDAIGNHMQPTRQEVYYFGTPAGSRQFDEPQLPVWIEMTDRVRYGVPGNEARSFKFADDTRGEPCDPTTAERSPSPEGIERARRYLANRFPGMTGAPLLESRVCLYENSPDGDLIIDHHPEARNLWIVGGGSGHGFKLSPSVGRYVADRMLEKTAHLARFGLQRLNELSGRRTQFGK